VHPANRVALWLWLVSFLPWLERLPLFVFSLALLLVAMHFAAARLRRAFPRLRWLLLAMLAVYAWATPGQYLWSGWLAPTREGLQLGFEQILRMLAVIASLQLLLQSQSRDALFAGLFALARPLDWLGISRERIAIRLALTMEMTEALLEEQLSFHRLLRELEQADAQAPRVVCLTVFPWSTGQRCLLALLVFLMAVSFWLGRHGAWL